MLESIVSDSFLANDSIMGETLNYDEVKSLLPMVKNFDLVIKFYENDFNFTKDELVELSEYLLYMGSKRIIEILVLMKSLEYPICDFRNNISRYLVKDYDNLDFIITNNNQIEDILLKLSIFHNLDFLLTHSINKLEIHYSTRNKQDIFSKQLKKSLIFASNCGHLKIVQILLYRGRYDVYDISNSLMEATIFGHFDIVKFFLNKRHFHEIDKNHAFLQGCRKGHLKIVELLLDNGADIHFDDDIGIMHAVKIGSYEIVKLLLEKCRYNNKTKYQAIASAMYYGRSDIAELFPVK